MISQEQVDAAVDYVVDTDFTSAVLSTNTKRAEFKARKVRNTIFLMETGTIADRQAKAEGSKEYEDAMMAYFDAHEESEKVDNKRHTMGEIIIPVWRSIEASRRKA